MEGFDLNFDGEFAGGFNFFDEESEKPGIHESLKLRRKGYGDDTKIFLKSIDVRPHTFTRQSFKIIKNLKDFRLPEPGEQLRIRTQTQINLISIIMKIISAHGKIEDLTIATYTLNRESISVIEDFIKSGRVGKVNLLIASSYSFRDKKWFSELKETAIRLSGAGYDFHMAFAWSHFKITLARAGKNYYQFEGSLNYSTNNMAENLVFENSKDTYDHDYEFINNIMLDHENKALEVIC